MPEHDDKPPPAPTPEEVVASVRPAPPAPAVLPPDPPTETAAAPAPPPSRTADFDALGIDTPIGRVNARSLGFAIVYMLGGAVLGQTVLPAVGLSLEPVEVRDLRISDAECAARLDLAEQRQARTEARLISAEQSVAEARTGLRDLMEACTR